MHRTTESRSAQIFVRIQTLNFLLLLFSMPIAGLVFGFVFFVNCLRRETLHRAFGEWDLPASRCIFRIVRSSVFSDIPTAFIGLLISMWFMVQIMVQTMFPVSEYVIAERTIDVMVEVDISRSISAAAFEGQVEVAKRLLESDDRILTLSSDGSIGEGFELMTAFAREATARGRKLVVVIGNVKPSEIPVGMLAVSKDAVIALRSSEKLWLEFVDGQFEKENWSRGCSVSAW